MNKDDLILKSTCNLFRCTDRMHRRIFENAASHEFGIHRSQHIMLMCLSSGDQITQKTLAERMNISAAAVAVTVKKLEAGGFIERNVGTDDGRQNIIQLTEKGKSIVDKTQNLFTKIDSRMLEGISDEQLEVFYECLEKMHENLIAINSENEKGKVML